VRTLILWVALTAAAVVVGFGLSWVALFAVNAVLPPFRPEDDDTLREFVPAALAYGTWGITSLVGAVLAWRSVRRRPSHGDATRP
jgi:hypothetical protein